MIFSLQKRFLLLLLLPVFLFFLAGVASYLYARSFLLNQWAAVARLKLEKTAHQIQMKLDRKRELLDLIVIAETIPDPTMTRAFLLQQLSDQEGVSFVDIQTLPELPTTSGQSRQSNAEGDRLAPPHSLITSDPWLVDLNRMLANPIDVGRIPAGERQEGSMTSHNAQLSFDEHRNFLKMSRIVSGRPGIPPKRVSARIAFSSFMDGILEAGPWQSSYACLATADGTILAHTDPSRDNLDRLGQAGDPLENMVVREMKTKTSGTVMGRGYPPDRVAGFFKVPSTADWYLVLVSKGDVILAPIVRFGFNYALAGLICLIGVGLLIRSHTRPIARSVAEISRAAAEVEKGNFTGTLSEDRSDEIGLLKQRFNKMIRGLQQRDLIERTFGRYVDRKIATELVQRPEALQLGGKDQTVTIMMADLRGFTRAVEGMKPQQVISMLNRYFSRMIHVIEEHKGIIVDFYGDGILVFFNGTDEDVAGRALDAVKCAAKMQGELEAVSRQNLADGLPELRMGIGIHTGEVVVGNIGSETRAKYGIVGSPVNETDRIQSCAEGGTVLISDQTFLRLKDGVRVIPRGEACLKGLKGARVLYELEAITV